MVAIFSRQDKPRFLIDSRSPTFPRQLRYAVLLYSEDLFGSVLLVDRFYWIEVYYNGLSENCFCLCHIICEAIHVLTYWFMIRRPLLLKLLYPASKKTFQVFMITRYTQLFCQWTRILQS